MPWELDGVVDLDTVITGGGSLEGIVCGIHPRCPQGKGSLKLEFCCSAGKKTEGLYLGGRREGRKFVGSQHGLLKIFPLMNIIYYTGVKLLLFKRNIRRKITQKVRFPQ